MLNTGRTEQISIHALREEGDPIPTPRRGESNQFLSTPSARRATPKAVKASVTMSISIHALREEGDRRLGAAAQVGEGISIHALREEGDPEGRQSIGHNVDFYPRPPRGGRPPPWRCRAGW